MADEEEQQLSAKITSLGEQIKVAKQEKKPKEEWDPILQEMLSLKAEFKTKFGKDFGPPPKQGSSKKKPAPTPAPAAAKNDGPLTEQELAKLAKKKAKAEAKAEKERQKEENRRLREEREKAKADRLAGVGQEHYGNVGLVQSKEITDKVWTKIENLQPVLAGQAVLVRGHLQKVTPSGKILFVLVRSSLYSVQGVAAESKSVTSDMIKYIASIPSESIVDMKGIVRTVPNEILAATQKQVEIQITDFHCIAKAQKSLPFQMDDACRKDATKETDVGAYNEDDEEEQGNTPSADGEIHVGQKMRLDYRWLDLRTPANQSIFRIESMVGTLFREFLIKNGFVEIHTPKLIGGASEGGSDVFTLDYFGQPACLAMSPQLHKQMAAACSGFERVFEVAPVFRAENSHTRRHLCEFTGLDLEMAIHEHYDEVLQLMADMFVYIFDGINERCKQELERVREQHPFEDLEYLRPSLKLTYAEGCALLREAGVEQGDYDDLNTENEKKLGDIVKAKYGTDFFFMDKYPLAVRPFYTMPCPENPKLSNSYDFFIRGQEIVSGAQRIHDPDLIEERAKAWDIDLNDIKTYIDSFRHGAMPHGGGGVGLERVVMLFLGLPNIRKSAWFPRDPKRIAP